MGNKLSCDCPGLSEEEAYATRWRLPDTARDFESRRLIGLVPNKGTNVNGDPAHLKSTPDAFQERPVNFSCINGIRRWSFEDYPWIECQPVAWRYAYSKPLKKK